MTIVYKKNVPISEISTMKIGGFASEVIELENETDVSDFFSNKDINYKFIILGGGSNVVFPDGNFETPIIKFTGHKINIKKIDKNTTHIIVDAGMVWDKFVEYSVANNLSGVEALSYIPGNVGSTPVQNVGAYGIEIKDVMVSLRAFDLKDKKFVDIANAECAFAYRDSIFKNSAKGRYFITQITFSLSNNIPKIPNYPGVAEYFSTKNIPQPTLSDIRNAIIAIRTKKLPDPREIASVGSFFKNPIVSSDVAQSLKQKFPKLAVFSVDENNSKIGAGSLIDVMGWKGKSFGNVSIYTENALVLVNNGNATREELTNAVSQIIKEVQKTFDITLEPEPEYL